MTGKTYWIDILFGKTFNLLYKLQPETRLTQIPDLMQGPGIPVLPPSRFGDESPEIKSHFHCLPVL